MNMVLRTSAALCAAAVFASCDTVGITAPPPPADPAMAILPGATVVVKDAGCTALDNSFLPGETVCATFNLSTDEDFETQARVEWRTPTGVLSTVDTVFMDFEAGAHSFNRSITLSTTALVGSWSVRLCQLTCDDIRASATFTVTSSGPAAQTITFPDPGDKVYGDGTFGLAATADSGLPVSYSTASTACSVSDNTATIVAAGTCTIVASQAGNGTTWAAATPVSHDITVAPREVTVTADAQEKMVGEADPTLTYSITSGQLIGTDDFTGALTRQPGETVGVYAIEQGSLTLGPNYDLDFVGANLTITSAVVWDGFFAPVLMGEVTTSSAGSTIPLGFRIYVDGVQYKSTEGITFEMTSVSCGNDLQALGEEEGDEIALSGSTTLRYAGGNNGGAYLLNWKTPSEQGCYEVTVSYAGSSLSAVFNLWQ